MASSTEHRAGREKHTQRKKEGSRFVQGNKSVFILQCNYNENLDNSDAAPWQMSAQQPSQQPRIVFMSSWVCDEWALGEAAADGGSEEKPVRTEGAASDVRLRW